MQACWRMTVHRKLFRARSRPEARHLIRVLRFPLEQAANNSLVILTKRHIVVLSDAKDLPFAGRNRALGSLPFFKLSRRAAGITLEPVESW